MLLIKTYLSKSTIPNAGIGCFSAQFIPKGTKIWTFTSRLDHIFSIEDFSILNNTDKQFVSTYSYSYNNNYYLCVDNARFFNHSDENFNTLDPHDELVTYALRDIQIGEEILSNYASFGITESDLEFNMRF